MQNTSLEGFRLSPQQKRLWLLQQGGGGFHTQSAFLLQGEVEVSAFEEVLRRVVQQHEILRTTFPLLPGIDVPLQVIRDGETFFYDETDLSELTDLNEQKERIEALLQEIVAKPFDFEHGPLCRCHLLKLARESHLLVVDLPSLCADPVTPVNLMSEIVRTLGLDQADGEPVQYADFAEWQNELLEGSDGETAREFWRKQNALSQADLKLPLEDTPRAAQAPQSIAVNVTSDLITKLTNVAHRYDASVKTVLFACWQTLLWRLTGTEDLTVHYFADGRNVEQLEEAIGLIGKYLPINSSLEHTTPMSDLLLAASSAIADAESSQDYYEWDHEIDVARWPVCFSYQDIDLGNSRLEVSVYRQLCSIERFKLELACRSAVDSLVLQFNFDTSIYASESIKRLAEEYLTLVADACDRPDALLGELNVLSDSERRLVVHEWNDTRVSVDGLKSVPELFAEQVARTPNAIALVYEAEQLTFAELNGRANQLAQRLRRFGVGPEARVGLCVERSLEMVVGLLGIMKAGGAYVPLDPAYPRERLRFMLADGAVQVLVTQAPVQDELKLDACAIVLLDQLDAEDDVELELAVTPEHLAYVIYTSGSSGTPKGVMVQHASVVNLAAALQQAVYDQLSGRTETAPAKAQRRKEESLSSNAAALGDFAPLRETFGARASAGPWRVGLNASLAFDASVKQVVQLLAGSTLVLLPEELRREGEELLAYVERQQIAVLDCTPTQLQIMLEAGLQRQSSLVALLVGGEAISSELWQELQGAEAGLRYFNVYGPTECTVDATVCLLGADPERVTIGRPVANVQSYILDARQEPVPVGVVGELYIGGAGVARGYLEQPGMTAERFVPDPFSSEAGARIYRTGDLARYRSDGQIEYVGRADGQVKLRGYRIELGEIESALRRHEAIADAVVVVRDDKPNERPLVAYVLPKRNYGAVVDNGTRYRLPNGMLIAHQNQNETDYLYKEIFEKQIYLQHGIELPEKSCIFDVGANIGMFTLFVSQYSPGAKIYAFEPIKPIFDTLEINAKLYGVDVELRPFGLSHREKVDSFTYYPRYSMMSGLHAYANAGDEVGVIKRYLRNEQLSGENGAAGLLEHADGLLEGRFDGEVQQCLLRRLSDVIRDEKIERIDLLKIDVQRAELDVLKGIDEDDWSRIQQVVMEVHDDPGRATEGRVEKIVALLRDHGFEAVAEQDDLLTGTDRYNLYAFRPQLKQQAVIPRRPSLAPAESLPLPSTRDLQVFLEQQLPDYMIPTAIVVLSELPLTPNGKIDKRALPSPDDFQDSEAGYVQPQTPIEEILAGIWAEVLQTERVSVDADFFSLGGHSLLATQVVSRAREAFRIHLSLRTLFDHPTIIGLAEQIEIALKGEASGAPAIRRVGIDKDLPLSFAQQRLWFLDQLEPGNAFYNSPAAIRLTGRLHVSALERTLNEVVRRHEVLRTRFVTLDGEAMQMISPPQARSLTVVDLTEWEGREEEAGRLAEVEARQPFDLSVGPLLRVKLLRLGEEEHVVLFTMHHIISDGWSTGILVREVAALYEAYKEGRESPLPELTIQYADYAVWQREWLQGEVLEQQLAYWRKQLGGELPVLQLPADRPRPAVQSYRGKRQFFSLTQELSEALKRVSRAEGVTLFMTLLAAFQVLLSRYSGQSDIVVGSDIANRTHTETEGLIGFFANMLAIRTDLGGDPTFGELLKRVREIVLGAHTHQDVPFEKLVEELQPERHMGQSPLFRVTFVLQNAPLMALELKGLTVSPMKIESESARFDMTLSMAEQEGALGGALEYNTELFEQATVERLLGHFARLLEAVAVAPWQRLSELPLLTEAEERQLRVEWNETAAPYAAGKCIHELVEERARLRPTAVAVTYEGQRLTYGELNGRANQLARYLRRAGIGLEARVGLCVERSLEMVVGMLGVLKAGGAYVPLDPRTPLERLSYMLADAGVSVLLTQAQLEESLPGQWVQVVLLDEEWEAISGESAVNPEGDISPDNLAYVIYTSGSTGQPKGVLVTHRGVPNLAAAQAVAFGIGEESRVLQFATPAFDASVSEVWVTLAAGARLVLAEAERLLPGGGLGELLREQEVTVVTLPPSVLRRVAGAEAEALARLSTVVAAGEACEARLAQQWNKGRRFCNAYGPTEVTVCATIWTADEASNAREAEGWAAIGKPLANTQVYVMDAQLRLAPVGVMGELCVGGVGLGRGYAGLPGLTAERFIPNPFSEEAGARLYRTGDVVRWLGSGELEFVGRRDSQVKVRGYRIELGEIEEVMKRAGQVREAVVIAREEDDGERRLVAYVVRDSEAVLDVRELREQLRQVLPEYMVPGVIVELGEMPQTSSGKVDRRALAQLEVKGQGQREGSYQGPRTLVEEGLCGLWQELLRVERVGIKDNFFELGGHSLLATQLVSRVREAFGVELGLRELFERPTVAGLAEKVEAGLRGGNSAAVPPLVAVSREERELPLSYAQQRLWFLDQLEPGSVAYNIPAAVRLRGQLDVGALERTLTEVVRRHEVLRTRIEVVNGAAVQVITSQAEVTLPVMDLSEWQVEEREGEARRIAEAEAQQPFALSVGPLLRVKLLRLGEEEHVVLFTLHHIVSDGWSTGILVREVAALYEVYKEGRESRLAELTIQYADYAVWQREWLQGEVLEQQLAYWRRQLGGELPVLQLPTDKPRPAVQTQRGRQITFNVPTHVTTELKKLSRAEGVTLFMTLLALFKVLLSRYSGQSEVVVGTPIAGRNRLATEDIIGLFVNTLVLRTDLSSDPTVWELLGRVRKTTLEAYVHQDIPFERLVDELRVQRSLSFTPLFQVMFSLQNAPAAASAMRGLELSVLHTEVTSIKFDLTLDLTETGDEIEARLSYNADLFDAPTIHRMSGHFQTLLAAACENPSLRVSQLPLLTSDEQKVFSEWNDTGVAYESKCAHQLFEEQADRTPNAIALVHEEQELTYRELNTRANQLARYLRRLGVDAESRVALCVERSLESVVGMLGILKAGGAYVPLDPQYPAERLSYMLEDAGVSVLLTQASLRARLLDHKGTVVALDQEREAISLENEANPNYSVRPGNLAYVIYTSGSTGRPKGVMVTQGNLVNTLQGALTALPLDSSDTFPSIASFSFDISLLEVLSPLLSGARSLLLSARDLLDANKAEYVLSHATVLHAVPELMRRITTAAKEGARSGQYRQLRWLLVGGDAVTPELVAELQACFSWARIEVLYGPTETTVICTRADVTLPRRVSAQMVGRPMPNVALYVLDQRRQPVPVGVAGELFIGGDGITRGYLGRPELTAEKFIPNPYSSESGARLYRTGDLVRWLASGELEFLGRVDRQVKLRGYRIELGEIETMLMRDATVHEAVVIAREDAPGEKRLVAYLVGESIDVLTLRDWLKEKLPDYMLPAALVPLEAFPLTPTGKVDRRRLPAPGLERPTLQTDFAAPQTAVEETLCRIWEDVLKVTQIGVDDNFFELGGDSIMTLQVAARANEVGLQVSPRLLFQHQSVAELAFALESTTSAPAIEEVSGPFPLTPVQKQFLNRFGSNPHHFNQAVVLVLPENSDASVHARVLAYLVQQHDALRLRFARSEGTEWRQHFSDYENEELLESHDLRGSTAAEQDEQLAAIGTRLHASLNVTAGPIVRAAHIMFGSGRGARLIVIVHHLAVDSVSWRILLEDWRRLYSQISLGREVVLSAKTTSYGTWSRLLNEKVRDSLLDREIDYWTGVGAGAERSVPWSNSRAKNFEESTETIRVELSDQETSELLGMASQFYSAQPHELLIAGLGIALCRWIGAARTVISLEGHGRDDRVLGSEVDLSRTVGWFTSIYPVELESRNGDETLGEVVRRAKERLRSVPNGGVGYGMLRDLGDDDALRIRLAAAGETAVVFNYFGRIETTQDEWRVTGEYAGAAVNGMQERIWEVEVTARVVDGKLGVSWRYSRDRLSKVEIERVAGWHLDELRAMVEECHAGKQAALSYSDFTTVSLDSQDLDALIVQLGD